jgi:hypothetical protein
MNARLVLVAACSALFLESEVSGQTRVGLLGGVNLGQFHPGESGLTYSTRAFPAVGATVDVGVGRNVFLRAEPMFLRKGSDLTIEADGFLFDEDVSGSLHLTMSAAARGRREGGTGLRPYFMAGPTFGYLLSAEARARGERQGLTDGFKRGDLGVSVGGGLQLPAGPASVFVEARYSQGLWDVLKDTVQDPRPRNRGLLVGAGVTFPIGAQAAQAEDWPRGASATASDGFCSATGSRTSRARTPSCWRAITPRAPEDRPVC